PRSILFAAILPLMACADSPVKFHDTIDLHFDFGFFQDADAGLHEPYVQGADFRLSVTHRKNRDMTGWWVMSADEDMFNLRCSNYDPETLDFDCEATAAEAGITEVVVFDDRDEPVGSTSIEIALPDRVELLPHGPLIIDRPELIDDSFQVLEGGTSTWLARYYRGDLQLHGNGALTVDGGDSFTAWTEDSFLFEDRDWLQGIANVQGEHPVSLMVDGVHITDTIFTALGTEQVDHIELHGMDESAASPEANLVLLAQAYDAADTPVYGVEYDWQLDGVEEWGEGDLYRYTYNPENENLISASFDGLGSEVTIHGEGYVDSTNDVGCSSLGGSVGGLLGVLVGLLGITRRREQYRSAGVVQYPGPANR
ncbi:MAG: hypothetical protein ACI8RZ_006971, partial [Myxococcota bacterium]